VNRVTSRDGTTIAFERLGDGPPVIVVGGLLCDRALIRPTAEELAKQHLTVFWRARSTSCLPMYSYRCSRSSSPAETASDKGRRTESDRLPTRREVLCEESSGGGQRLPGWRCPRPRSPRRGPRGGLRARRLDVSVHGPHRAGEVASSSSPNGRQAGKTPLRAVGGGRHGGGACAAQDLKDKLAPGVS
jgi:hypothetical protein